MRRRLTVSHGHEPSTAPGKSDGTGGREFKDKIEQAGLANIFKQATESRVRAVSITSVTDGDLKRKRSFAEKDCEVLSNLEGASKEELIDWVKSHCRIAWKCHKGLKPESPNQDSFSILIVENDFALYCVYDGHGPEGHFVSDIARSEVVKEFLIRVKDRGMDIKESFEGAFAESQRKFQLLTDGGDPGIPGFKSLDASMSGTTCTMAYHSILEDKIWIAHVGDSRAVLGHGTQTNELTIDHKPSLPEEKARIEKAGGRVVFDGFYNHRVFAAGGMYPGLNMSRALGDCIGHNEAGLSAVPDVKELSLQDLREKKAGILLLLCTDGVWEFVESKDAIHMVMQGARTEQVCTHQELQKRMEEITKLSWDRWMQDSDNEISDDITGIAVILDRPPC